MLLRLCGRLINGRPLFLPFQQIYSEKAFEMTKIQNILTFYAITIYNE